MDNAQANVLADMEEVIAQGPFRADWESLAQYQVPDWYQDAKFGIFIHWGVYSVPAFGSEWYPRHMYLPDMPDYAHHAATYGPQTEFGYKDLIPLFTAERFDPKAWAELFADAGARYVVPVAEHHDGFAMYDTALSPWNAARMGPKRDTTQELADAVRAHGLTLGVSNHRAENWWFFNGGRAHPSDVQDDAFHSLYNDAHIDASGKVDVSEEQPTQAHLENWLAHQCEMVDKFQPAIVYYDWWIKQEAFKPYLQKFAAFYYNRAAQWGRQVAINYKYDAYPEDCAVYDIERGQLDAINPRFWQTDTAVGIKSWSHIDGESYKSPALLIGDLVDVVSKNGSLLLNVGPRADGMIGDEDARILREMGSWLRVNGEAIYGTRPWKVFGEGPTVLKAGAFSDKERTEYVAEDIRFTVKGDALYAITLAAPGQTVVVHSLGTDAGLWPGPIGNVAQVGSDTPLTWTRTADALTVTLPPTRPVTAHGCALRITP